MWNCALPNGDFVLEPTDITPLLLTEIANDRISDRLANDINETVSSRAFMTREEDEHGALSIGCSASDGSTDFSIYFKMRTYAILIADFSNLRISLSAGISLSAEGDENGNITKVAWAPYYDETNDEIVYSARGTRTTDIRETLANYVGK